MIQRKLVLGALLLLTCSPIYAQTCKTVADKGTVALTFDDGPSATDTPKILSILEQNHIKATFFVVGQNALKHPQYLKQMMADGDAIGNHTLTHPQMSKLSGDQLSNEVNQPETIIYNITGVKPQLFRFPYGAENKRVEAFVISQGLKPVSWNNCPEDYRRPGADVIAQRVLSKLSSGQVILLHDGPSRREQTVNALPKIIDGIRKKGLGFSVLCS